MKHRFSSIKNFTRHGRSPEEDIDEMPATKLKVVGTGKAKKPGSKSPVYNSVKRFALEGLGDLIRVLMESVDDSLFELSDKADTDQKRSMYFEAMRELRLKREGIKQKFNHEMKRSFERVLAGKPATARADDDEELTLIELDDLEDRIAIGNMVSRARPQFEDDIFAVSERMKLVLKRKDFREGENPLEPRAICESFHNASELLETNIQVKLIFYRQFERYVINNLENLYQEVNELFEKKGVLPGFKADQERMKQTTRFMANRIKGNSPKANVKTGLAVSDDNLFATLQQAIESLRPLMEFQKMEDLEKDNDLRICWDIRIVRGEDTPFTQTTGVSTLPKALSSKMRARTSAAIQQEITSTDQSFTLTATTPALPVGERSHSLGIHP